MIDCVPITVGHFSAITENINFTPCLGSYAAENCGSVFNLFLIHLYKLVIAVWIALSSQCSNGLDLQINGEH